MFHPNRDDESFCDDYWFGQNHQRRHGTASAPLGIDVNANPAWFSGWNSKTPNVHEHEVYGDETTR